MVQRSASSGGNDFDPIRVADHTSFEGTFHAPARAGSCNLLETKKRVYQANSNPVDVTTVLATLIKGASAKLQRGCPHP
jgi:hypothetical protein